VSFRIGFGYDVHQLAEGRNLMLGGVNVPHTKGCLGHSDGDVVIHAICDALLGAANLGDIGLHFPDTSSDFKDIDSKILLKRVMELLKENSYSLGNIDVTICLQKPKIQAFIPSMKETLATTMKVETNQVSVKATTTEKLGFVGNELGVSCYAVALINS
jgi:2-C-methyl-D-erythritol 2,4-cyclodiphosphate synthase